MSDKNELMTTGSGFLALADFNMNESMAEELEGLEGGFDQMCIRDSLSVDCEGKRNRLYFQHTGKVPCPYVEEKP